MNRQQRAIARVARREGISRGEARLAYSAMRAGSQG